MASRFVDFSTNGNLNTTVGASNIAENCAPSGLNNAARDIIAYEVDFFLNAGTIASAATTNLGTIDQQYVEITGTTGITAFGTPTNKVEYIVKFAGILTITHNGTSLILPGAANITTAAGDIARFRHEGSGNWRCTGYMPASGTYAAWVNAATVTAASADLIPIKDASDGNNPKFVTATTLTALSPNKIINRYYAEYASNSDLSTAIPFDDTIPTSSEGTEVLSVSVTTTTATQRVRINFSAFGQCSNASGHIAAAFFRDTTCVGVTVQDAVFNTVIRQWSGAAEDAPGAAATYTYSVRVGSNVGTVRLNGSTAARVFGGAAKATMIVDLIEP